MRSGILIVSAAFTWIVCSCGSGMQAGTVEEASPSSPDTHTTAADDAPKTGELKNIVFSAPTGWIVQCMMYQEYCDIRNPLESILINVSSGMCVYNSQGEKVTPQYLADGWTEDGTWTFLASDVTVWSTQSTLSQKLGFFLDDGAYCWEVEIEYPQVCTTCEQMAREVMEMAAAKPAQ
jgi:ABC-type transport system substrate-binding protein